MDSFWKHRKMKRPWSGGHNFLNAGFAESCYNRIPQRFKSHNLCRFGHGSFGSAGSRRFGG
jgi:hypothetical protein